MDWSWQIYLPWILLWSSFLLFFTPPIPSPSPIPSPPILSLPPRILTTLSRCIQFSLSQLQLYIKIYVPLISGHKDVMFICKYVLLWSMKPLFISMILLISVLCHEGKNVFTHCICILLKLDCTLDRSHTWSIPHLYLLIFNIKSDADPVCKDILTFMAQSNIN